MPVIGNAPSPVRNADTVAPTGASAGQLTGPQIIDAWKAATLDASITDVAHAKLKPKYDAVIQAASEKADHELDEDEIGDIVDKLDDKYLESARAEVISGLAKNPAGKTKLVDDAIAYIKAHGDELRNPFKAIALGDPKARAKERVLWEDKDVMVLVDRFVKAPKVLVVPKAPALTPLDVAPKVLDEVGKIAQAASGVFTKLTHSDPADTWVNPPQLLTVGQVHMHVQPNLRPLRESVEDRFWAKFETDLGAAISGTESPRRRR